MRDIATMPERLEAWLNSSGHPGKVVTYQLMTGGSSRDMARVVVDWPNDVSETLVMRGDPPPELATLKSDR
jgi:hypothetical protein